MRTALRWAVVAAFVALTALQVCGQTVSFPVDSIKGPVCVLHDTVLDVAVTLSPVHSRYNVTVTDGLAHIRLTQAFVNVFANIRDIVYVFPLPHDGAVHAMSMLYRDSLYVARIYEKELAQHVYDSVVAGGGSAALLIQTRPNVFQQSLGNIARGDTAWVDIEVTTPLKYNAGVYELAIPTMIGERYQSAGADPVPGSRFWNPPENREGQSLQINVLIQTGYEVADLQSPTHTLNLMMVDAARPLLELNSMLTPQAELPMPCNQAAFLASAATYPNRDFVLRFSRRNAATEFSLASVYSPAKAFGHFALNLFPDTTLTAGQRPDLEIVLLVDISGSQSGWPLAKEKEIASSILDRLLPSDRLCVLAFSDAVYWCFGDQNPVSASAQNIATARTWINARSVLGGTQLLAGIQAALSAPATTEHTRYYVFLTDGFITNEEAIYDALRDHPSQPTVFTFGAGNSLNRYFLEQTAAIGEGYATEITQLEDVVPKVDLAWQKISSPQVRNVTVDFGGAGAFDLIMPFGANLYRESPVVVYGKYRNPGVHTVTVRGYRDGQPVEWARDITFAAGANLNRMVPQVWARQKIEQLVIAEGATTANKDSIIAISIEYQVLSKYTAFLAINPQPLEGDQRDSVHTSYGVGIETSPAMADLTRVAATVRVAVEHGTLCVNAAGGAWIQQVEIVDLRGRAVHTIRLGLSARVAQVRWDGRLADGTRLGAGRYVVRVKTDRGRMASTLLWR